MEFRGSLIEFKGSLTEFRGSLTEFKDSLMEFRGTLTEFRGSLMEFRGSLIELKDSRVMSDFLHSLFLSPIFYDASLLLGASRTTSATEKSRLIFKLLR
jgi:hypothetical protein